MASADTHRFDNDERASSRGDDSRRSNRRGNSSREEADFLEHLPVSHFIAKHFPLLTANEYFRIVYDYVVGLYNEIRHSFLVSYLIGWIMAFMPLLNPAFFFVRLWYWFVWMLVVKPSIAFWKRVGAVLGINAVVVSIWMKTLQLIDYCGNYIMNALGSIYKYINNFWQQIMEDSSNAIHQISKQAAETLRTVVRLVKILYVYAQQLGDLILCEKVEAIIVWTALTLFSVAKWLYRLNKTFQRACDSAIEIIIETWHERNVEIRSRHSKDSSKSSTRGGVRSSGGHASAAAASVPLSSKADHSMIHETSVLDESAHDESSIHHHS